MNCSFVVCDIYFLVLIDADINHKHTLFLHEQLCCVVQDFLLMLLDAKDTLFNHELHFGDDQDFHFLLLDNDIAHKDTLSLH